MALSVAIPNSGGNAQAGVFTWTPTTDTAIDAGDVLTDTEILTDFFPSNGAGAYIVSVSIVSAADIAPELDIYFLDSLTSLGTVDSAPSISDANALTIQAKINIPTSAWKDLTGCRMAYLTTANFGVVLVKATANINDLYATIVTQTAATFAGLTFRFGLQLL